MRAFVTAPLGWILILGLLVLAWRCLRSRRRRGDLARERRRRGLLSPFFLLWLLLMALSTDQVARWVAGPLETGIGNAPLPLWTADTTPEVIVVLAGGLAGPARPGVPLSVASRERLFAAIIAARSWPSAAILFSGGSAEGAPVSSAARMAEEATRLGIDPSRILLETKALSTRENAQFCGAILRARAMTRVALVSSAVHMRRARDAFWRVGVICLPVKAPAPLRGEWNIGQLLPDLQALVRTSQAVHEWLGIAWYRARGWSGAPYAGVIEIKNSSADGETPASPRRGI